jgi:hypothetical protein
MDLGTITRPPRTARSVLLVAGPRKSPPPKPFQEWCLSGRSEVRLDLNLPSPLTRPCFAPACQFSSRLSRDFADQQWRLRPVASHDRYAHPPSRARAAACAATSMRLIARETRSSTARGCAERSCRRHRGLPAARGTLPQDCPDRPSRRRLAARTPKGEGHRITDAPVGQPELLAFGAH